jgi:hypothetical protein
VSRAARPDLHHGLDVAVTDVADNARLLAIVDEQLSISGRLQVNTALAIYGVGPMSSLALCARSFGLALE